jgi:hypothetical protein
MGFRVKLARRTTCDESGVCRPKHRVSGKLRTAVRVVVQQTRLKRSDGAGAHLGAIASTAARYWAFSRVTGFWGSDEPAARFGREPASRRRRDRATPWWPARGRNHLTWLILSARGPLRSGGFAIRLSIGSCGILEPWHLLLIAGFVKSPTWPARQGWIDDLGHQFLRRKTELSNVACHENPCCPDDCLQHLDHCGLQPGQQWAVPGQRIVCLLNKRLDTRFGRVGRTGEPPTGGCSGGTDPRFGSSTIAASKLARDRFGRQGVSCQPARLSEAAPGRAAGRWRCGETFRFGSLLVTPASAGVTV